MRKFDMKQAGFTLVEIIAVLVILGILAATAIPKYFDLQADAERKAALAAVAEAQARINLSFGQYLLKGGKCGDIEKYSLTDPIGNTADDKTGKVTIGIANSGTDKTIGGWLLNPGGTTTFTTTVDTPGTLEITTYTAPGNKTEGTISAVGDEISKFKLYAPQCSK